MSGTGSQLLTGEPPASRAVSRTTSRHAFLSVTAQAQGRVLSRQSLVPDLPDAGSKWQRLKKAVPSKATITKLVPQVLKEPPGGLNVASRRAIFGHARNFLQRRNSGERRGGMLMIRSVIAGAKNHGQQHGFVTALHENVEEKREERVREEERERLRKEQEAELAEQAIESVSLDLDTSWKRGALTASQLLEEAMKQAAKLKEMAEDVEADEYLRQTNATIDGCVRLLADLKATLDVDFAVFRNIDESRTRVKALLQDLQCDIDSMRDALQTKAESPCSPKKRQQVEETKRIVMTFCDGTEKLIRYTSEYVDEIFMKGLLMPEEAAGGELQSELAGEATQEEEEDDVREEDGEEEKEEQNEEEKEEDREEEKEEDTEEKKEEKEEDREEEREEEEDDVEKIADIEFEPAGIGTPSHSEEDRSESGDTSRAQRMGQIEKGSEQRKPRGSGLQKTREGSESVRSSRNIEQIQLHLDEGEELSGDETNLSALQSLTTSARAVPGSPTNTGKGANDAHSSRMPRELGESEGSEELAPKRRTSQSKTAKPVAKPEAKPRIQLLPPVRLPALTNRNRKNTADFDWNIENLNQEELTLLSAVIDEDEPHNSQQSVSHDPAKERLWKSVFGLDDMSPSGRLPRASHLPQLLPKPGPDAPEGMSPKCKHLSHLVDHPPTPRSHMTFKSPRHSSASGHAPSRNEPPTGRMVGSSSKG